MGSILPCCFPFGNAGGRQILRCQGFEVNYYDFTLDAPAQRDHTSNFINISVRLDSEALRRLQRWGNKTFVNHDHDWFVESGLGGYAQMIKTGIILLNGWVLSSLKRKSFVSYERSSPNSHSRTISDKNAGLTI